MQLSKIFFLKISLVSFLILLIATVFVSSTQAAFGGLPGAPGAEGAGSSSTNLEEYQKALEDENINLQQFTLFNLDYTTWGFTRLLLGVPILESDCDVYDPATGQCEVIAQAGLLAGLTNLNAAMYSAQPISGVEYFADLGRDLGIVKPAYAQATGIGFKALDPVKGIWQRSRNLAYLAFVLIFVIIGFMIMFRTKIDPRTATSVQNALPGIVIALILVTFSYAIGGLIIDLTEVSTRVIAGSLADYSQRGDFDALFTDVQEGNVNIFDLMQGSVNIDKDTWSEIFKDVLKPIPYVGDIASMVGEFFGGGLFGLIFGLALVFAMFKVFFMLVTALVTIILLTIVAPFMFLAGALPGRGGAITGWFKSMVSAALVFPITFTMLLLAAIFASSGGPPWEISSGLIVGDRFDWAPVPLGNFGQPKIISQFVAVGIILTTPKAADMVKEALTIKAPAWGGEAAAALGGMAKRIIPFA